MAQQTSGRDGFATRLGVLAATLGSAVGLGNIWKFPALTGQNGEIIDLGSDAGIIDKSGSWFAFGSERLGQGKENVRALLEENAPLREAIEAKLIEHLGMTPTKFASSGEEPANDEENDL